MRLEEFLTDRILLDYVQNIPREKIVLSRLFPELAVDDFEADMILGREELPVSAQIYAFDTPTEIGQRLDFEKGRVGMELIKEKMKLDEREIMRLKRPRSNAEQQQVLSRVYNDAKMVVDRIDVRIKRLQYDAFTKGVIDIKDENGYTNRIDYNLLPEQKIDLKWLDDPEAPVLDDLADIKEKGRDNGVEITHAFTSQKTFLSLLKNKQIRAAILGSNEEGKYVTPARLNEELVAMGLMSFGIDDSRYFVQKVQKKKLVKTPVRYLEENTIVFAPDGSMGNTLRGLTPSGEGLRDKGIAEVQLVGKTVLTQYAEVDPVAHYIKGEATAGITFPRAGEIFIGTVKNKG